MSLITLRRATLKDAAAYAGIMGHPQVFPQLLQVPFNDEEVWRARLADLLAPGKQDLMLVAELHGEVVGNAGLHPAGTHLRRRHALGLGIAVAPHVQGQGVGSALMEAVCDYADHWAQALRLELSVFVDNHRAIRLYQKFGFVHEGTHRAFAMRNGQYVDVHSMARLHPSPPVLPAAPA